ncbi:PhnA domain-containing protein [Pontibacter flavimaris]|uniref:PhnA protein n=1 Tax=Pontibacter flavimaris TaxID=1797110 RepID=A0A1Q5PGJ4_9BACT|nr:PhnA domain-containing protein [Pontibacter flavimaris]OKL41358.1 PhnA protein [Pontibacter flavimaris]
MEVNDSNGNTLHDGDSVQLVQDLKVKGRSAILRSGSIINNIRLTDSVMEVEGRIGNRRVRLKTVYLRKV